MKIQRTGAHLPRCQQFYQQYGFVPTAVEANILREFPGLLSDPRKLAEARAAANSLAVKNYHDPNYRNSQAYDSALRVAIGLTGPDGVSDGPEVASEDTAVEATRGSKYDHLSNYRDQLKAAGFYRRFVLRTAASQLRIWFLPARKMVMPRW